MRKLFASLGTLLIGITIFLSTGFTGHAQDFYTNTDTGYRVIIEDDAGLLSSDEITKLAETMKDITAYGNVAFKTLDSNTATTEVYARNYLKKQFGTESSTVFLIDMDNRNLWIYSDGKIYRTITTAYANTITDNVYTYASAGNYYECAEKTFSQMYTLLEGGRISQPMKYISNALLALILALSFNYAFVSIQARLKKPSDEAIMKKIHHTFHFSEPKTVLTNTTRVYSPPSDSDSGSSGGSSGGGGGGGSSSGGGGGHSF